MRFARPVVVLTAVAAVLGTGTGAVARPETAGAGVAAVGPGPGPAAARDWPVRSAGSGPGPGGVPAPDADWPPHVPGLPTAVPGLPPGPADTGAPAPRRSADPTPPSRVGDPRAQGARIFTGHGFDTCRAPSASVMRAWLDSPFRAVGVYFGGRGWGCPRQPHLNRDWLREVDGMGWRVLPVYVGSQSPCVKEPRKREVAMDHTAPWSRGLREGDDAVRRARQLGMAKRTALYLDMEAYRHRDRRCADTTLNFIKGWDRAVARAGYLPGLYSSSTSGITHMERARRAGHGDLPHVLWFARWRVPPSVRDEKVLHPGAWQPHRRVHQYRGNVSRTYGGRRLLIDQNLVDAPVAILR